MGIVRRTQAQGKERASTQESAVPREEIAKVAYELFEGRGRTPGHDFEDWLKAERIVRQRRRLPRR